MLYYPGKFAAYAVGTMQDVREYCIPADYHYGVAAYANTPTGAWLPEATAHALSKAIDRSYPTHSCGTWRLLEVGLTDEELVLLGEAGQWALKATRYGNEWRYL